MYKYVHGSYKFHLFDHKNTWGNSYRLAKDTVDGKSSAICFENEPAVLKTVAQTKQLLTRSESV